MAEAPFPLNISVLQEFIDSGSRPRETLIANMAHRFDTIGSSSSDCSCCRFEKSQYIFGDRQQRFL